MEAESESSENVDGESLSEVSEEAPAAADEEMEIDQQVSNFEEELKPHGGCPR